MQKRQYKAAAAVARKRLAVLLFIPLLSLCLGAAAERQLSRAEYQDRVDAIWTAQIAGALLGFQFEHKVAATAWVDHYPKNYVTAPVDDDWYYEMCAIRAFEKYGPAMTVEQLGEQWKENSCGSWGSSEQARLALARGIKAPDTGHPRYNKYWFTIGPQFSAEVYGALAPGRPNLAAALARNYGHVNGYAEAVDGAVFVAGMVSIGFFESDPRKIVREAATLIHPDSPYRKCLDQIIARAEDGATPEVIANEVEDRWRIEYPASNNAVPNGGLVAIALWFGEGDFLKTVNLLYRLGDYTDADCNAANAGAVLAAGRGMKCLPKQLVEPLHDRIVGDEMGGVKLTPPVDETISGLAKRTVALGEQLLAADGVRVSGDNLTIPSQSPKTQPAELFELGGLMQYWNPDWKLERAGCGRGANVTHLEDDVLVTWPRDPSRGLVLRREITPGPSQSLSIQVGADAGRAWELLVYAGNEQLLRRVIDGGAKGQDRVWTNVNVSLAPFAGKPVQLRLYQHTLLPNRVAGNAYWRNLQIASAPLTHAHAHNDYQHTRPLLDALDNGFCSVEADVHLVDGQLLVAHDLSQTKTNRTLESLYLEPLRERIRKNGGRVYANGPEFTLLVELKGNWKQSYPALRSVLTNYSDILTSYENGRCDTKAVTVIITGNRAKAMFASETIRYAALDGDLTDLNTAAPAELVPLISSNWGPLFSWRGKGPMPAEEKAKLQDIVKRAHAQGRRVRFWGAPNNTDFWRELRADDVDLLNIDDLAGAARFFAAEAQKGTP